MRDSWQKMAGLWIGDRCFIKKNATDRERSGEHGKNLVALGGVCDHI